MRDVVFETFCYYLPRRLKILGPCSLILLVLSEISRMMAVSSREYISLCRKAYKYVKILHVCVKYGKKDTNEHLFNQGRKRTHQKTCERRRATL